MAKNKKSKILASMLAVSTMAVFYAAPVMAAKVVIDGGNVNTSAGVITINSGTFNLNASNIAEALKNQSVRLGANGNLQVASGNFLIGEVYIGATADTLTLDTATGNPITLSFSDLQGIIRQDNVTADNKGITEIEGTLVVNGQSEVISTFGGELTIDGNGNLRTVNDVVSSYQNKNYSLNNIGQNTEGIVREGDENSGGHRTIIEDQLVVNRDSKVISNKNASFTVDSSGNLVASTLGNKSGTFGVDGEGAVKAANGAFTVDKDGNTVSKGDVTSTAADGTTYTLNTVGNNTSGIASHSEGKVTTIEGAFSVNENGYIYNANGSFQVTRDGAITASSYNGVTLATYGEQVLVGDIDVSEMADNTEGIVRLGETTTIEKTVSADKWGLKVLDENGKTVASINSTNGGINAANGKFHVYSEGQIEGTALSLNANDGAQNVYIDNSGTARFGAVDGNNVRVEDGVLTVNRNSGQVAALSENGLTLTSSNDIRATLNAEQIANLNNVVQEDGNVVGTTVKTTSGADLDVVNNRTQNMTATEDSTIFDGKVTVNGTANITNGHGKYRFDDGLLDFNIDNGKNTFTMNSEHTSMNVGGNTLVLDNSGLTTSGAFKAANGNFDVDTDGNITAGTYNGVKIGMNEDGDIILGDGTVIDDNFNSDNVAGITRKPLDDSAPGSGNTTFIEQNTAISADGIVVTDPESGVSTKTKYNGFYVKDEYGNNVSILTQDKLNLAGENLAYKDSEGNINVTADTYTAGEVAGENVRVKADGIYVKNGGTIVSSLKDDGLMLTDQDSGESHTLNATDIADIKGIDRDIVEETFGDVTTTTKTTTIEGALKVSDNGFISNANESFTVDANGTLTAAGGRFTVSDVTGAHFYGSDSMFSDYTNINGGRIEINGADGSQTVITGNSITTETLNVENIKLGNSMTDKDGNTITIGAAGVIDIEKDGNTVFRADTDNFEAHYDNYDLTLDGTNGFALSNETSSFTLKGDGFAFAGPVHLGNGTQVKFSHNGTDISLSSLVNRVENLEQKTQGISFDETTGSTTIADKVGTDGVESNNSMTVGNNGTTFENGTDSKTNINGGAIDADSSSIGNDVSGGSGSGSSGMTGNGTYTNGSEHSGHFVDKDSSYKFTNDANGFTGTVTDGKHTTTIENGAMGSNTTVKGDNASASSGVGIGNDGAFISDSVTNGDISHTVNGGSITDTVTNGDMTVTEVKDENGSATTVKDANGSSTVSQDRNGQTVSTGTGTSVNTGNDFSVTDNETGKSIYMSDIGHVEDIDSEIQNSDGSKTTVVDAVNNEAEIRRNEIERVDGRINNLENRVGELEDRIDKVGAMAAAIANLRTMGYDPAAPTEVAVGIGQYRDETGAALGLFHYPNRDFMLSLSVSTSGDEVMGGIGATWKFGRKSPEKVAEIKKAQAEADARRAEEAKLAKAEEMKQAAKEAKIKAQQERHAKLAAERAAQAEAAK